ncbi:MAG: methionine adenosyltransferase domain-containing protein [Candidatus Paceibacterota bacterium]
MKHIIKTAEGVAIGHPDKICDQISDAILDEALRQDPYSRVAVETMGGHSKIFIVGEITSHAKIDFEQIAKDVYKSCGNNDAVSVTINIVQQSPQIKAGVDVGGAGDQGIMVGYACNETKEMMPLEVMLSRQLSKAMGPRDGKSQVTVEDGKITKVVTSVCGDYPAELLKLLKKWGIKEGDTRWLKNPAGEWTIGGFAADTGLTGRKLIVDNYGPNVSIGGGCFSGKDNTKVDRSAAYMARKIAVDLLKKEKAGQVFVRLAYAIGVAEPVMACAEIHKRGKIKFIPHIKGYDLTPAGIIKFLNLCKPQFRQTAMYGHFGNGFKWDK